MSNGPIVHLLKQQSADKFKTALIRIEDVQEQCKLSILNLSGSPGQVNCNKTYVYLGLVI
jgi:hypothetical protein